MKNPRFPVEVVPLQPRKALPICANCQKGEDGMWRCYGALDRRCASPIVVTPQ